MQCVTYFAASVPRSLRQTRLGYIAVECLIGTRSIKGANGSWMVLDVIMLPQPEFQRMKMNIGLQHVIAPALKLGSDFTPAFIPADAKHVSVPLGTADPAAFARAYFIEAFGLDAAIPCCPAVTDDSFKSVAAACCCRKSL